MAYTKRQRQALERPRLAYAGGPAEWSLGWSGSWLTCLEVISDGRGGLNWAASVSYHRRGRPTPLKKWKPKRWARADELLDELLAGLDRPALDLDEVWLRMGYRRAGHVLISLNNQRVKLVAHQRWLSLSEEDRQLSGLLH